MKAGPVTVRHLLENRQRFCVPIYQRHYVWTRAKQWEPFWNDVRTKAIERLAGRETRFSHYMGAVVLEARSDSSSRRVRSFQVVDGQQRLTTFQIFMAAARDYATSLGFEETKERIESFIFNEKKHLMEDPEIEVFKVWATEYDRELLTDILKLGRKALRSKYIKHFYATRDEIYPYSTVPNILGAYGYFFERIKHSVETDDLDVEFYEGNENEISGVHDTKKVPDSDRMEIRLDTIWEALVEEFKVVEIVLEEGDDAQVIFETLNDRGEALLATDLVRNNIFQRADARRENAEKLFAKHWQLFEDPFWERDEKQGRYKKKRSELFLGNFIAGKIGNEITLSKLFSEYKAFIKPSDRTLQAPYSTIEEELIDLNRFGHVYRRMLEHSSSDVLGRFARDLYVWDVTTVFPLVLRLATENIEIGDLEKCLSTLLSYVVRRAVCGLTTKNYNKFFLSVIRKLDGDGWTVEALWRFLVDQKSPTGRFPSDLEFEQAWLANPVYEMLSPGKVRSLLEPLEIGKRREIHETDQLKSDLTVEHVLPNDWLDHWPLSDGTQADYNDIWVSSFSVAEEGSRLGLVATRERIKNSIGNLTLLTRPLNSSVSNGSWETKREALQKHSLLIMNQEISSRENWNEGEIEQRSLELFGLAKYIWIYPDI